MKRKPRDLFNRIAGGALIIFPLLAITSIIPSTQPPARVGLVAAAENPDHVWYIDPATNSRFFIDSPMDADFVVNRVKQPVSSVYALTRLGREKRKGQIIYQSGNQKISWYVDPRNLQLIRLESPQKTWEKFLAVPQYSASENLKGIPVSLASPSWLNPPAGYRAEIAATGFSNPRVLALDPNGRLVVSDFSENGRVIVMDDANGDGRFENQNVILRDLFNCHGLAFADNKLYVALEHSLNVWNYDASAGMAYDGHKMVALPPGGGNFPGQGHRTRTLTAGQDGYLYLSIGSRCDHCTDFDRNGHAIIERISYDGTVRELVAKGLRNTVFFIQHPWTGEWWGNDMGRDDMGDNLPPDELNILQLGNDNGGPKDYGWPYCWDSRNPSFDNPKPELCRETEPAVAGYPAHSAPLGLRFIPPAFSPYYTNDLLTALHGSTVKNGAPAGYKIVRVEMDDNRPVGVSDFITGFMRGNKVIAGRPVDLIFGADGNLYITDDYAKVIHRVYRSY